MSDFLSSNQQFCPRCQLAVEVCRLMGGCTSCRDGGRHSFKDTGGEGTGTGYIERSQCQDCGTERVIEYKIPAGWPPADCGSGPHIGQSTAFGGDIVPEKPATPPGPDHRWHFEDGAYKCWDCPAVMPLTQNQQPDETTPQHNVTGETK